ncbi:protein IDA-LIKE 1-like [Bidens hawaiensis]|uniref:protein IDA-LIKE 1-like n=1 Tax=Bidens hawaiensis TaxID=980011 RepID=UPI00404936A7
MGSSLSFKSLSFIFLLIFVALSASSSRVGVIQNNCCRKQEPVVKDFGLVFNMLSKRKRVPPSAPSKRHNFFVDSAPPS